MGMNQHFSSTASWDQSINLLDHSFPLAHGSRSTASAHLVYVDYPVLIQADGSATGLSEPSQFVGAGGNMEAPQSILLDNRGLQVEIEPAQSGPNNSAVQPHHRMQLLTRLHNA